MALEHLNVEKYIIFFGYIFYTLSDYYACVNILRILWCFSPENMFGWKWWEMP